MAKLFEAIKHEPLLVSATILGAVGAVAIVNQFHKVFSGTPLQDRPLEDRLLYPQAVVAIDTVATQG